MHSMGVSLSWAMRNYGRFWGAEFQSVCLLIDQNWRDPPTPRHSLEMYIHNVILIYVWWLCFNYIVLHWFLAQAWPFCHFLEIVLWIKPVPSRNWRSPPVRFKNPGRWGERWCLGWRIVILPADGISKGWSNMSRPAQKSCTVIHPKMELDDQIGVGQAVANLSGKFSLSILALGVELHGNCTWKCCSWSTSLPQVKSCDGQGGGSKSIWICGGND